MELQQLIKLLEVFNNNTSITKKTQSSIYDDCIGKYCIIRSCGAGVFFGIVDAIDDNFTVKLSKARRIHYWDNHTACSISELAKYGIANNSNSGQNSRVAVELELHYVQQIIEIIPCSEKSINVLKNYKVWAENE